MMAKILLADDERMKKTYDFELLLLDDNDRPVHTEYIQDSTVNNITVEMDKRYKDEFELSVLDYGDELKGVITAKGKNRIDRFTIIFFDFNNEQQTK